MNEFDPAAPVVPADGGSSVSENRNGSVPTEPPPVPSPPVDPVRSAAGRLGGKRVHMLALLGREYEREHGLKAGRQRLRQLIQLGKRYEVEHGLRAAEPRRRERGDAWLEFVVALARVIKPAHRPALEQLLSALRTAPKAGGSDRVA